MWELDYKDGWSSKRIDASKLWCWRRLLRVPWTARRSHQSILKEISPEYSLEGLILKLKLQYFGHLKWRTDSLEKTLRLGKIVGRRRRDHRGWDGWMASPTPWTWVWASFGSWWWTGLCFSFQFSSVAQQCPTFCDPMNRSTTGLLVHHQLLSWVYPNSCPLNQWCHPIISSSVTPFSSCPQSFPASGSLPISQLFASGGQSIGVSASTSFLLKNTQDWSPLGWTGWISLQSKGLSRVFSNTRVQKHQFFSAQLSL